MYHTLSFLALLLQSLLGSHSVLARNVSVTVGGPAGSLEFIPKQVTAKAGDLIVFTFSSNNYSIVRSSYSHPCQATDWWPFHSPILGPVGVLHIYNTDPIWAYEMNRCQAGMVFAINPPQDKFAAFQAAALGTSLSSSTTASRLSTTRLKSSATMTRSADPSITMASSTTSSGSPSDVPSPPVPSSTDYQVLVGGPTNLIFDPSTVVAQPGDTVTFNFTQRNSSVMQSTFDAPCVYLPGGFDTGFVIFSEDSETNPTYQILVNNTDPIWAFAGQRGQCGQGMVFAINPPSEGEQVFTNFVAKAKNVFGAGAPSTSSASLRWHMERFNLIFLLAMALAI